jgi:hypothetical protein
LERRKEELEERVHHSQVERVEASRRRAADDLEVETRAREARVARGKWVSTKILRM